MGAAPMAWALWSRHLRHDPAAPGWADRDRFVLSAGHGSMLLYSLLHLTGYKDITLQDIKNFRQFGSQFGGGCNIDGGSACYGSMELPGQPRLAKGGGDLLHLPHKAPCLGGGAALPRLEADRSEASPDTTSLWAACR